MPVRPGLRGLQILPEAQHDAALARIYDVETARQPDDDDQRDQQPGARGKALAASVAGLAPAALAAKHARKLLAQAVPDFVEVWRAIAAPAPIRVVQCHSCLRLCAFWIIAAAVFWLCASRAPRRCARACGLVRR